MPVLERSSLEKSPLADLHAIASELGLDGYRRLRKADLIEALIARQEGTTPESPAGEEPPAAKPARRTTRRTTAKKATAEDTAEIAAVPAEPAEAAGAPAEDAEDAEDAESATGRRRRGRRGGRTRIARGEAADADETEATEAVEATDVVAAVSPVEEPVSEDGDPVVEGVVELLPNGSGFMRVRPPEPSDDDVYISAAQVKRCELVSGDRIAGPRRSPRRSERFPSLIRIDAINGVAAAELAQGVRFDDLPAAYPAERLKLGSEDPTVKAIEWLTPIGKGSRVTIVGAPRSGKTEALLRLGAAIAGHEDLKVSVALAGVRPEEVGEWKEPVAPEVAVTLSGSPDAQSQAVEQVVDHAKRLVSRGANVVVLIDSLEGLHPGTVRKAMGAARNIVDGGSLTVIATASAPVGGETTVIALDGALASTGRFPALDLAASGSLRPELLVGDAGAEAIARARAEAIDA